MLILQKSVCVILNEILPLFCRYSFQSIQPVLKVQSFKCGFNITEAATFHSWVNKRVKINIMQFIKKMSVLLQFPSRCCKCGTAMSSERFSFFFLLLSQLCRAAWHNLAAASFSLCPSTTPSSSAPPTELLILHPLTSGNMDSRTDLSGKSGLYSSNTI